MPIFSTEKNAPLKQNDGANSNLSNKIHTLIALANRDLALPSLLLSQDSSVSNAETHYSYFCGNPLQQKSFLNTDSLNTWQQSLLSANTNTDTPLKTQSSALPFHSGWVGYYSYPDLKSNNQDIIAEFYYYPWSICLSHKDNKFYLLGSPDEQAKAIFEELIKEDDSSFSKNSSPNSSFSSDSFKACWEKEDYKKAFSQIREYLLSGDCYQVNLTQPHKAKYKGAASKTILPLYKALNPSFGCYFQGSDRELISVSPERFIKIDNHGHLEAKPIKGTIKRSSDINLDNELINRLKASAKDQAENLMIVDLLRNDLSMSAKPGSVKVDKLFDIESHPNVHHLVSTISAELKENTNPPQAISNAFPGGSITGAPKKRAMEIIEELEFEPRSLYCGSFGYYSDSGHSDFNILIRSLEFKAGTITCWGGGGITIDSTCDDEYEESLTKIRRIMEVVESI